MTFTPRIDVEASYAEAIGRAVYTFTYLEWGIIWLGEGLQAGFMQASYGKTAGQTAQDFQAAVKAATTVDPTLVPRLEKLADDFIALVVRRNGLVHATPYTNDKGEQRLDYHGKKMLQDWTPDAITAVVQEFENAAIEANDLFNNHLHAVILAR